MDIITTISGLAKAGEQQSKLTLISNVNVFDGKTEKLHENMYVLVKDNLIETVSNEPLAVVQTDNVTLIDGGGRTLMPGMIDALWLTYYANIGVGHLLICPTLLLQDYWAMSKY